LVSTGAIPEAYVVLSLDSARVKLRMV